MLLPRAFKNVADSGDRIAICALSYAGCGSLIALYWTRCLTLKRADADNWESAYNLFWVMLGVWALAGVYDYAYFKLKGFWMSLVTVNLFDESKYMRVNGEIYVFEYVNEVRDTPDGLVLQIQVIRLADVGKFNKSVRWCCDMDTIHKYASSLTTVDIARLRLSGVI